MENTFRVKLIWMEVNGKMCSEEIQKTLQGYLPIIVPLYNMAAEALNPFYQQWNDAYLESRDGRYERYIADKMNKVLCTINNKWFTVKAKDLGEDGTQICFFHNNSGLWCSIVLEPVK